MDHVAVKLFVTNCRFISELTNIMFEYLDTTHLARKYKEPRMKVFLPRSYIIQEDDTRVEKNTWLGDKRSTTHEAEQQKTRRGFPSCCRLRHVNRMGWKKRVAIS